MNEIRITLFYFYDLVWYLKDKKKELKVRFDNETGMSVKWIEFFFYFYCNSHLVIDIIVDEVIEKREKKRNREVEEEEYEDEEKTSERRKLYALI